MSAGKFADANYITVLTLKEVLIYDGNDIKLQALGQKTLTGWRCKTSIFWRLPIHPKVENENLDIMLLNLPDSEKSINNI